jgi:5-methylcytosine-specific restriction endonuclease McrA
MRLELTIFIITCFILYNIYTEGKFIKTLFYYKKYYQMAAICLAALFFYWLIKKKPDRARQLVASSNEYLKYLPVDRHTSSMLTPIFDFTNKYANHPFISGNSYGTPANKGFNILNMPSMDNKHAQHERKIMMSGGNSEGKKTKRSVSETKKKFVASRQDWKCGKCGEKLPAWFEVDHKIRLEYGGSNHIDNLVALCRNCHGEKTAMENL